MEHAKSYQPNNTPMETGFFPDMKEVTVLVCDSEIYLTRIDEAIKRSKKFWMHRGLNPGPHTR